MLKPAKAEYVVLTLGAEAGWCSRARAFVLQTVVLGGACGAAVPTACALVGDLKPTLWWLVLPALVSLMYTLPAALTTRHAAAEELPLHAALVSR